MSNTLFCHYSYSGLQSKSIVYFLFFTKIHLRTLFFIQDLILPIPIQAGMFVILQDQGRQLVDISAHCRNVALRAGHFASRTLSVTHDIWRKVLETTPRDESSLSNVKPTMEFITDYVVCNSSLEPIRFGQVIVFLY